MSKKDALQYLNSSAKHIICNGLYEPEEGETPFIYFSHLTKIIVSSREVEVSKAAARRAEFISIGM